MNRIDPCFSLLTVLGLLYIGTELVRPARLGRRRGAHRRTRTDKRIETTR